MNRDVEVAGLEHEDWAVRKIVTRRLVSRAAPAQIRALRRALRQERHPEVVKWLAMVLARAGDREALAIMADKREEIADTNALDWLAASMAVLSPDADGRALRLLRSSEPLDQHEGAIWAWASPALSDETLGSLKAQVEHAESASVRRWSSLALYQHGAPPALEVMLGNARASDYLLREWSLHTMVPLRHNDAVDTLVELLSCEEHPRVVEWVVHALAAYDTPDLDSLIIGQYDAWGEAGSRGWDTGVRAAIAGAMAARSSAPGQDHTDRILASERDPVVLATALTVALASAVSVGGQRAECIDLALERLEQASALAAVDAIAYSPHLTLGEKRHLESIVADPKLRAALRLHLSIRPLRPRHAQGRTHLLDLQGESMRVIGVVIALREEFDVYRRCVGEARPELDRRSGHMYYTTRLQGGPVLVATVVGRKGYDHAAVATTLLIDRYHPTAVLNLGISGAVSGDLSYGDVVLGEQLCNYLANSKAVEDPMDQNAFVLALGSETYRPDEFLLRRAAGLQHDRPDVYEAWADEVQAEASRAALASVTPRLHAGKLASGPTVGGATGFKRWLVSFQRDFLAIDMESSGVGVSALADAVRRTRLLVVRGVSDLADENKNKLEEATEGALRVLAMYAATQFGVALVGALAGLFDVIDPEEP